MTRPPLVVVGATGFVGRAVVESLGRRGVEVAGVSSRDDLSAVAPPGCVLVLAARVRAPKDAPESLAGNVALFEKIARHICRAPPARIVHLSSASVWADDRTDLEIDESTPPAPGSPYGAACLEGERIVGDAAAAAGASHVVLRPCKIYGPGDAGEYGPSGFLRAALAGRPVVLHGDGAERRDHVFIDDVVRVVEGLVAGDATGTIAVASGESRSFREVLDEVRAVTGRPVEVEEAPRTRPAADIGYRIDRLRSLLPGHRPTPLAEGLRALYDRLR